LRPTGIEPEAEPDKKQCGRGQIQHLPGQRQQAAFRFTIQHVVSASPATLVAPPYIGELSTTLPPSSKEVFSTSVLWLPTLGHQLVVATHIEGNLDAHTNSRNGFVGSGNNAGNC